MSLDFLESLLPATYFGKGGSHAAAPQYNKVGKSLSWINSLRKSRFTYGIRPFRERRTDASSRFSWVGTLFGGLVSVGGFRKIAGAVVEFQLQLAEFGLNYLDLNATVGTIARFV